MTVEEVLFEVRHSSWAKELSPPCLVAGVLNDPGRRPKSPGPSLHFLPPCRSPLPE